MKRKVAGILAAIAMIFTVGVMPAFAASLPDGCVESAIISNDEYTNDSGQTVKIYCDTEKDGGGIYKILAIVVNVMTMGVGILGTLGIVISGVQYMTSAGNEAQMTKAKNRIVEVVIGLVIFGVMWAVLQWLIPGGVL